MIGEDIFTLNCKKGASLIEIVFTVSIVLIGAAAVSSLMSASVKTGGAIQSASKNRRIKLMLSASVSCSKTKESTPTCNGLAPIALFSKVGKTILAKNPPYSKVLGIPVRAFCSAGSITIEAKDQHGNFLPIKGDHVPFHCEY